MDGLFVVTGGGTGMGRDVAIRLAEGGASVIIVGRRRDPLQATAEASNGDVEVVSADISTVEGAETLRETVGSREVAGIVAAAGGQGDFNQPTEGDLAAVEASWSDALAKNLYSAVLPIEALSPRLREGRGRVVLISSTSALDGRGGPYATAKAAITGYGMDLAIRLGERGITANVVAPGFVAETGFFEAGGYGSLDASAINAVAQSTLVGRVGTPRDITHVVLALLAEDAGWITGQVVSPNGGTNLVH